MTWSNRLTYIERCLAEFGITTIDGKPVSDVLSKDPELSLTYYFETYLAPKIPELLENNRYYSLQTIFRLCMLKFMPPSTFLSDWEKIPLRNQIEFLTDTRNFSGYALSLATSSKNTWGIRLLDLSWRGVTKQDFTTIPKLHEQIFNCIETIVLEGLTEKEAHFANDEDLIADIDKISDVIHRPICLAGLMNMAYQSAVRISGTDVDPTELQFCFKVSGYEEKKNRLPRVFDRNGNMPLKDIYAFLCSRIFMKGAVRQESLKVFCNLIYTQFSWSKAQIAEFQDKVKFYLPASYEAFYNANRKNLDSYPVLFNKAIIDALMRDAPYPVKEINLQSVPVELPEAFVTILQEIAQQRELFQAEFAKHGTYETEYNILFETYNKMFANGMAFYSNSMNFEKQEPFLEACKAIKEDSFRKMEAAINAVKKLLTQGEDEEEEENVIQTTAPVSIPEDNKINPNPVQDSVSFSEAFLTILDEIANLRDIFQDEYEKEGAYEIEFRELDALHKFMRMKGMEFYSHAENLVDDANFLKEFNSIKQNSFKGMETAINAVRKILTQDEKEEEVTAKVVSARVEAPPAIHTNQDLKQDDVIVEDDEEVVVKKTLSPDAQDLFVTDDEEKVPVVKSDKKEDPISKPVNPPKPITPPTPPAAPTEPQQPPVTDSTQPVTDLTFDLENDLLPRITNLPANCAPDLKKCMLELRNKALYFHKKQFDHDKYSRAYTHAQTAYNTLFTEINTYYANPQANNAYQNFKNKALPAIEAAGVELNNHRDCNKILANIFAAIICLPLYLLAVGVNYLYKGKVTFFATDSSQKLDNVKDAIEKMGPGV